MIRSVRGPLPWRAITAERMQSRRHSTRAASRLLGAEAKRLPAAETRDYVPKFYATVKIVRDVKQYGFHFEPQHTAPKHETVAVREASSWPGSKNRPEFRNPPAHLQPELCQPVTPPGKHQLRLCVPLGSGDAVQTALATCPLPSPEEMRERRALAFNRPGKPEPPVADHPPRLPLPTALNPVIPGSAWLERISVPSLSWRPVMA